MEACTCVTYIAKSNNGSMEMTNHTSWSRLCTYVEGGWWKWNEALLLWISLSFIRITWGHGYIIVYLFFFGPWCVHFFLLFFWVMLLGHAIFLFFFLSLFLDSPCLIWRILERSLNMEFYFVDGWNGIADFQCRSSAGGVHKILIKQVWKDISLGSQNLKKLNVTTRHICVKICITKVNIWLW